MYSHKNIYVLIVTHVLLFSGAIVAYINSQLEVAFVAFLMLVVSLLPHYLKGVHHLHVPLVFIYSSIVFIFASVGLGQFSMFYDKFHWYDAFLHFISATVIGIVGFLIIYIFYATNRLRIPRFLVILFSFSFAMMIGGMWEIFEFFVDMTFGTNLQVSSLEDTMVDMILNAGGAILVSIIGYLYLIKINIPVIGSVIKDATKDVVDENKITTEKVINKDSD